jgi:broad specificity phosphatase PhoE
MVVTRLLLARHGETHWNYEGRWQGQANLPLNASGWAQAAVLAFRSRREQITAVYSSELQRSVCTARAVAAVHNLPVYRDARFNEIDLGQWEGLLYAQIKERFPDALNAWEINASGTRPPGGETIEEVEQRVLAALGDLATVCPQGTVCLIGHKVTNAVIRSRCLALPLAVTLSGEPQHAIWEYVDLTPSLLL